MPARYLTDSNVIIDFQLAGHLEALTAAASTVPLAVVEQVYDEVATPAPGNRPDAVGKKRKAGKAIQGSQLRIVAFLPGSPAEGLYTTLVRPGATTHDRGEAASIAFARHEETDLILVTGDTNGAILALNELSDGRERVMRVPVFVRRLYEAGALPASVVRGVAARVTSHGLEPSWWASWLAGLPP